MSRRAAVHEPQYIDAPDAANRFLASIGDAESVALDTEAASFHRFVDRIYLLQLSTRSTTAILDPLAIGKPESLGTLLQSPRVEIVFHDADYDLRLLHQDYGWHAAHLFDTRVAAQLVGIRAFGLAALLERFLDVRLDKKHQRADWSRRPLPQDMLDYAAQDTMYLLDLRDRLQTELERLGRWAWAREEFDRLEGTRWEPAADDGSGFLRLKGARDLTRRQLAILRELATWRDGVARELDRATFRVAGNEVLLEVARQAPRAVEALSTIKGMPRGIVERRGREVLDAVSRGLAVSDEQLPKFPRAPRWERDSDFESRVNRLRSARERVAHQLDMDPGFLVSRERLETIARRRPRSMEELAALGELRNWQLEVLGTPLLQTIAGA